MTHWQASLRHSRGDNSTARNKLRLLAAKLIQAKNRKCSNYNCFLFGLLGLEGNTPRICLIDSQLDSFIDSA
jgi:hypothetical protein